MRGTTVVTFGLVNSVVFFSTKDVCRTPGFVVTCDLMIPVDVPGGLTPDVFTTVFVVFPTSLVVTGTVVVVATNSVIGVVHDFVLTKVLGGVDVGVDFRVVGTEDFG